MTQLKTTGEQLALNQQKRDDSDSDSGSTVPILSVSDRQRESAAQQPLPAADNLTGVVIDKRFRIISRLGKGGMSSVFKAEHLHLQKLVAIKLLHPREYAREKSTERFQQEARVICTLNHPNIVKVYAFGLSENDQLYLAMEYLEGSDLAQKLKSEGKFAWPRVVSLSMQISEGLEQAHERGVVHRDLKPGNVIVQVDDKGQEVAKIVDFGIARLNRRESGEQHASLTGQGNTCGTPAYMSPEQCRGESVDARTDIYSFGCLLFELLTGRPPFNARTSLEVMKMQIEQEPDSFEALGVHKIPAELEAIVRKCMAKKPDDRYQSMAEVKQCLKALTDAADGSGEPADESAQTSSIQRNQNAFFKAPSKWIAAVAFVAALGGLSCAFLIYSSQSQVPEFDNEFKKIGLNDPEKIEKYFSLASKLISSRGISAGKMSGTKNRDDKIVASRLQDIHQSITALPSSLQKLCWQSGLVRLYVAAGQSDKARELAAETLSGLENFVAVETAQTSPDKNRIERASLESLQICRFVPGKKDHMVGKYNTLFSIYMAEGKLEKARQAEMSALGFIKNQMASNVIAEISVRQNLCSVLSRQGRLKEAEEELERCWVLCKRHWSQDSTFSKCIAKELADFYAAEGKTREAASLMAAARLTR